MSISAFSFIMSVIWCNIFIIIIVLLRNNSAFIKNFSIIPLLILVAACIIRSLFVFELPFTVVIRSDELFPVVVNFLKKTIFEFGYFNFSISIIHIVLGIWLLGSLFFLFKFLKEGRSVYLELSVYRASDDARLNDILKDIVIKSKKKTNIKIVKSSDFEIPMICGYLRPVIYMPDMELSDTEAYSVLLHEWTHFLHKDAWIKLLCNFICICFWWNPFVHILKKNINVILELRCDLKISEKMNSEDRLKYMESIFHVIQYCNALKKSDRYNKACAVSVLTGGKNRKIILQRFDVVLEQKDRFGHKYADVLMCVAIITAFFISNVFILQPEYWPTIQSERKETYLLTAENSYIKVSNEGKYLLYINGEFASVLDETMLDEKPFITLPIIN